MTTAQQVQLLKDRAATATARRAEAETAQRLAQKQCDQINTAIKDLGFSPETAEQDLAKLEAALDLRLTEALAAVEAEIAALDTVIAAAKQAGVL